MPEKCAIMIRVSSEEQAKYGYSIETQIEGCRKYAADRGMKIVAELVDSCSGNTPISERPEGKNIYYIVDNKQIDAVVVFTLDRTARDEKVIEYLLLKSYLFDNGVELHYADTGLDPYTMEGNLVGYIKAHAATEERKKIRERSMRGKQGKADSGKPYFGGRMPYGYRRTGSGRDAVYTRQENELYVVGLIYQWYVYGENGGGPISIRSIHDILKRSSYPSPYGRQWTRDLVTIILKSEIYHGVIYYGKTKKIGKKQITQPRDKWIKIEVPELAVVSESMYLLAQERIEKNKTLSRRNAKLEYLLRGHFYCGIDGKSMNGARTSTNQNGEAVRRYRCSTYRDRGDYLTCPNIKGVSAIAVEKICWNWVTGLLDRKKILEGVRKAEASKETELEARKRRLEQVVSQLQKLEKIMARLSQKYNEEDDEVLSEVLYSQMKDISKQVASLKSEKESIEDDLRNGSLTQESLDELFRMVELISKKLENPSYSQKRAILDYMNVKVYLHRSDTAKWLHIVANLGGRDKFAETEIDLEGAAKNGFKESSRTGTHLKYTFKIRFEEDLYLYQSQMLEAVNLNELKRVEVCC
jgi:site-specific DNA recombinase